MKKCPSGVVCIKNYSMFFIIIGGLILVYVIYSTVYKHNIIINNSSSSTMSRENQKERGGWGKKLIPSWPYTNLPDDPLLNPYTPPLKDERYFMSSFRAIPGTVPINVSTNIGAVDSSYRQVGIMTATNSKGKMVPLMGRPLFTNRDKWQYYSMSPEGNNTNIKLPISKNGRSCTNEYGCDKLYNGDTVYVEGLNEPYKITAYDNDTIKYLPFF